MNGVIRIRYMVISDKLRCEVEEMGGVGSGRDSRGEKEDGVDGSNDDDVAGKIPDCSQRRRGSWTGEGGLMMWLLLMVNEDGSWTVQVSVKLLCVSVRVPTRADKEEFVPRSGKGQELR
jgi:hypothetical protein